MYAFTIEPMQTIYYFSAVNPIITSFTPANDRYIVDVGDPVTFVCNATGIPPPSIEWYRGGKLLNASMDSRLIISSQIVAAPHRSLATVGRTLTVNRVMANDTDTRYSCNATNEASRGMASAQFELIVEGIHVTEAYFTPNLPPPRAPPLINNSHATYLIILFFMTNYFIDNGLHNIFLQQYSFWLK